MLEYEGVAWEATVREVCATLAVTVADLDEDNLRAAYVAVCSDHWKAAQGRVVTAPSGARSGYVIWQELWKRALRECGCQDESASALALEYYTRERRRRYRLFADAVAVLAELRRAVAALALITNGPDDTQRDKLAATGLIGRFDAVVTSGEVGVAKPDPGIFDRALHELGIAPAAAWHVGDSFAHDVVGARNAGLGAGIWLNRGARAVDDRDPAPWWEIRSLQELPTLLAQAPAP